MADSPFIPIITKIDSMNMMNMNIYVQSGSSGDNPPQIPANNNLQSNVINSYVRPVTAEQAVRELQRNGYFADIRTTVDEENYVSADELHETPRFFKSDFLILTWIVYSFTKNIEKHISA